MVGENTFSETGDPSLPLTSAIHRPKSSYIWRFGSARSAVTMIFPAAVVTGGGQETA